MPRHPLASLLVIVLLLPFLAAGPARAQEANAATDPAALVWESTGDPARPLREPSALTIDPQGILWVADSQHDQFQRFTADGAYLGSWGESGTGPGQFDFVRGDELAFGAIAFAPDGTFYIADTGNDRVQVFTPDRQFVAAWGNTGAGDGQFQDPIGIVVGPDGLIYVLDDYRDDVQVFTPDGAFVRRFGAEGAGPGQFVDVGAGIAVDRAGNVLVSDLFGGHVVRFAPDGSFHGAIGSSGGAGRLAAPDGLVIDSEGRIYVADRGNASIAVFTAQGAFLTAWTAPDSAPGHRWDPVAIALDGQGHAYVLDVAADRLLQFQLPAPLVASPAP